MNDILRIGLDVGSTTVKVAVINDNGDMLYSNYRRHFSDVRKTMMDTIEEVCRNYSGAVFTISVAGSGGISVATWLGIPFVQEVIAATAAIKRFIPQTDVAIELGGEDAKITFFDAGVDQRMNETCAGGTGAFIDQMASVLQTDSAGLDGLAQNYTTLYPIAARCGVFAKTDVMPLLNEGAPKEDIAASIFQAVVDQTVGGLACGRSIRGNVAFLGGPLHFLPQLRRRFIETLKLTGEHIVFPENAHFFVAMGAALLSKDYESTGAKSLLMKIDELKNSPYEPEISPLEPLFESEEELNTFVARHDTYASNVECADIKDASGDLFLGLDAGSTTTKAILLDEAGRIVYTWYDSNRGTPLLSVIDVLKDLYSKLPYTARIRNSAVTGYGEQLLQAALGIDIGEVETLVHCHAAAHFVPNVSFILDIGGQDMKCLYVKDGVINKIVLNEACSSGCGSFVETFAGSLGMNIRDFAKEALLAKHPVDLGSRCTVFMNSKVKQAQKEGASVADISAGLSYSVIKNALYKVIKVAQPEELGKHIVVQGGTFFNNAILRAIEKLVGVNVLRPKIAGLMGAFGAALIAKERVDSEKESNIISAEKLAVFTVSSNSYRCQLCSNHCLITVNTFPGGKKFISGNRCERGAGVHKKQEVLPNLFNFKYARLFEHYVPLPKDKATRGEIGMPRVLNMYENYPFWFTLFTKLGYHVTLSPKSSRELFNSGLETIPSQTVCFPAKLVHGHIASLIAQGVKRIFYPAVPYEVEEFIDADNHFNCPVVANYPEVIRLNVDDIKLNDIDFVEPYLPIDHLSKLADKLYDALSQYGVARHEIRNAVKDAAKEQAAFRSDIRNAGENALQQIRETGGYGIVLAGRPYHLDNEINHGIPDLIASHDVAVLTEDSVSHLGKLLYKLDAVDQWVYHSRLYRAANFVADTDNLELVQLNSFGCGLDAVTAEQVEEILATAGKAHTLIKIDEGSNLGAARIRVRSLLATMRERGGKAQPKRYIPKRAPTFSADMKDTHTILCPQLSPIHFHMMQDCLAPYGYKLELLPVASKADVEEGLRYVNNDACYPAITVVGQLIHALKSGNYDTERTALIISQTGGGCRATNYVRFLRNAATKAGFPNVPVIPFNMGSMESGSGFTITTGMTIRMMHAILYGDMLLRITNRTRPYETKKGYVDNLAMEWIKKLKPAVQRANRKEFVQNINGMVEEFDKIPQMDIIKPKVGVVGEILVKFHPDANNHLVSVIEAEGGEAVVPDFMDFVLYCSLDNVHQHQLLSGGLGKRVSSEVQIAFIEWYRDVMRRALVKSKRFGTFYTAKHLAELVDGLVSRGNQTGEGWLLTAEMIELIKGGAPNIVLVQPFACLPNHITGKGVMKELRRRYDDANIVAVDYDPGASEVNQLNRIKLMMSVALQNMDKHRQEAINA
ncbi:2-hydroxyacyl-CoA dehydratase [Deferribacterales bacterium RsTz2092]|nr:2-hydroxyglutaryl-CoA dehydratase [Deferribacterales bacterium]